jgi:hypothetical protein
MINARETDVAVDYFYGIDYHLSALLLSPGTLHGHVYICTKVQSQNIVSSSSFTVTSDRFHHNKA